MTGNVARNASRQPALMPAFPRTRSSARSRSLRLEFWLAPLRIAKASSSPSRLAMIMPMAAPMVRGRTFQRHLHLGGVLLADRAEAACSSMIISRSTEEAACMACSRSRSASVGAGVHRASARLSAASERASHRVGSPVGGVGAGVHVVGAAGFRRRWSGCPWRRLGGSRRRRARPARRSRSGCCRAGCSGRRSVAAGRHGHGSRRPSCDYRHETRRSPSGARTLRAPRRAPWP